MSIMGVISIVILDSFPYWIHGEISTCFLVGFVRPSGRKTKDGVLRDYSNRKEYILASYEGTFFLG